MLPKEEEMLMSARAMVDEPGSTTRLVIPDDVISSSMIRRVDALARHADSSA